MSSDSQRNEAASDTLGVNLRCIIIVSTVLMLMLFAAHCTWVTSNAYSSPSIVLASYSNDGYCQRCLICYFLLRLKH